MKRGIKRAMLVGVVIAAPLCVRVGPAVAAPTTRTWTGHGDGVHWSDAANWSGNAVPANGDSVVAVLSTGGLPFSTDDDISALHLSSLTYKFGTLTGQRLVVDTVANASRSTFKLPLAAGTNGNWALNVYQTFDSIDLDGHHVNIAVGPNEGPPPHFEGQLTFESIHDTAGGGSLSQDPASELTLYSPTPAAFAGTITGGRLDVRSAWSATSFDGGSVSVSAAARLNHVHIDKPSKYDTGLGVAADFFTNGLPHTPAQFVSLTMDAGTNFTIDTGSPALVVDSYVNLARPTLVLETDGPKGTSQCPGTYPIIDNRSAAAVVGGFGTIKGGTGVPARDPFAGKTLTAHYDAGDGNDVQVVCALAVVPSSTTTTTTAPETTTTEGPQLPATGSRGTPTLLLIAVGMLAIGTVAVRVRRRSSWRAGV